ncbi:TPA: hypothetical protein ACH3X2_007249 [Trebouxia sp. C0005]
MDVRSIAADALFRACFTACPLDPKTLLLDVRAAKVFKRKHILQAFCVRVTASAETLLDYSGASYDQKWSKDCWWDKSVILYGDDTLDKSHPVAAFLVKEKRAKSISIFKSGFEVFEEKYPFLCTQSVKANAAVGYPGEIIPDLLYLGNWEHAENFSALKDLGIKRIISIHNNPENLQVPKGFQHLKMTVADVHTQDITPYFNPSYDYIEEARLANQGVLVHCGAGVSRSASLCIAYLMRRFGWNAARARKHCQSRRSLVNPNDGFWRSLCAFEQVLGITDRSDPGGSAGGRGADAPALLSQDAAGQKVQVAFIPASKLDQAAMQKPAQSSDQQNSSRQHTDRQPQSSGADSPHSNNKRKRDSHRDKAADADSKRHHSRSDLPDHDSEPELEHRHRRTGKDDRGHKESKRRHRDQDDAQISGRDDQLGDRRGSKAKTEVRGDRDDRGWRGTQGQAAAAGSAAQDSGQQAAAAEADTAVVLDIAREGKAAGQLRLSLASNQRCVFGRQPGGCDVVLEHLSISRQHAQLSMDLNGRCFITDMASGHGTNVDGLWLRPKAPRGLQLGSIIKFGASSRTYTVVKLPKT